MSDGEFRCEVCGCPKVRWLRVSTVAEKFDCSSKKVRRLLKSGQVDGVRFGGEWRVDHRSLDRYVKEDSVRYAVEAPSAAGSC